MLMTTPRRLGWTINGSIAALAITGCLASAVLCQTTVLGFGGGCMTCGELIEADQLVVATGPPRHRPRIRLPKSQACCPAPVNVVNDCGPAGCGHGGCKLAGCLGAGPCGELIDAPGCCPESLCGHQQGPGDCRPHHGPTLPPPSSFYGYFRSANAYSDVWAGYAEETRQRHRNTDPHLRGTCDCRCQSCQGAALLVPACDCGCGR